MERPQLEPSEKMEGCTWPFGVRESGVARVPLVLVTGFLGSGKTTLLRRMAEDNPGLRAVFLVNEFGPVDIDGGRLAAWLGSPVQSVVGGSLFCQCKASEFVRVLREVLQEDPGADRIDALVVETSGMAHPGAIGTLLREHGLEALVSLRQIVAVVSPGRFPTLARNLPVVSEQVRLADLVVVNKCDLVDEATLATVEEVIRSIQPQSSIARAVRGRVSEPPTTISRPPPAHPLSTSEANPFTSRSFASPPGRTRREWDSWLSSLPSGILRLKGEVHASEGWFSLDRSVDSTEWSASAPVPNPTLVLITHDDEAGLLDSIALGPPVDQG